MKTGFLKHLADIDILHNRKVRLASFFALALFLVVEAAGFFLAVSQASPDKKGKVDYSEAIRLKNRALRMKLDAMRPQGVHIIIDTGMNRLYLKDGAKTLREAVISSGSGSILKDPQGKRKWVFDTPRGEFFVKTKYVAPAWTKPDWAFIEEGEAPPKNSKDRREEGVLGDYALGFGNGYFIHGTLYTRLLGRNVTHGCIRVGDEDLKAIYLASEVGTRIYIF